MIDINPEYVPAFFKSSNPVGVLNEIINKFLHIQPTYKSSIESNSPKNALISISLNLNADVVAEAKAFTNRQAKTKVAHTIFRKLWPQHYKTWLNIHFPSDSEEFIKVKSPDERFVTNSVIRKELNQIISDNTNSDIRLPKKRIHPEPTNHDFDNYENDNSPDHSSTGITEAGVNQSVQKLEEKLLEQVNRNQDGFNKEIEKIESLTIDSEELIGKYLNQLQFTPKQLIKIYFDRNPQVIHKEIHKCSKDEKAIIIERGFCLTYLNGDTYTITAKGPNKQAAEQEASRLLLKKLYPEIRVWRDMQKQFMNYKRCNKRKIALEIKKFREQQWKEKSQSDTQDLLNKYTQMNSENNDL